MANLFATRTNAAGNTEVRINGVELNWENLQQPRMDMNGNRVFDVQMVVAEKDAEKVSNLISNFNPSTRKFTARRMVFAGKPRVVDAEGQVMTSRVGNGSKGNVIMEQRTSKAGFPYMSLVAVQVTELVDYDAYKASDDNFMF